MKEQQIKATGDMYLNAVSIYNFHGWLMPPLHIKRMKIYFAMTKVLLLLITFTSLSYSDFLTQITKSEYQLVNFIYSEFHP